MQPFSRALIVESPHRTLDDQLRAFSVEPFRMEVVPGEEALIAALRETRAEILFKRSRVPVTRNVVEACPDLIAVQLCSIGFDSVDQEACADQGVLVFNDPVSNGRSVVELALGHLISLSRRLYETDVATRAHRWEKSSSGRFEVRGKRLGIVGLGNIGRQVARIAAELGLRVVFNDSRPVAHEVGVELGWQGTESLERLFRSVDMVSVHTSARDAWGRDNAGLLDPVLSQLGADRPSNSPRVFLNLARGNLHSSAALLDAVRSGAIRRAAVDVYPDEPGPGQEGWNNPYAEEPRIMCTPHIGAATQEAQPRIARHVSGTMEGLSRYGSIRDCVYSPRAQMSVRDNSRGHVILSVVHSTARGTKKAIDDAIYEAEASNLGSTHRDFDIGIAYDLSVMDRPLSREALEHLAQRSKEVAQDPNAVRVIRQLVVPTAGF
jgi:D-3-phosphoglycerate dehydrogenase